MSTLPGDSLRISHLGTGLGCCSPGIEVRFSISRSACSPAPHPHRAQARAGLLLPGRRGRSDAGGGPGHRLPHHAEHEHHRARRDVRRVPDAGFARLDAILVRKDSIRGSVVDAIGGKPLPGQVRHPTPHRSEPTPHFPAIAVLPETSHSGIVRAARGSDISRIGRNGTKRR